MFVDVINCILFIFGNVEHVLKLAGEYQVKGVLSLCIKCLEEEPKDEDNVIKIRHLANHSFVCQRR